MYWQDLPKRESYFTVRNALMIDLDNQQVVQYYSANTKIVVVQKCVIKEGTFYRTESAKNKGLNWAFRASAFGLPDERAPSVHSSSPDSLYSKNQKPVTRTPKPAIKQTSSQKVALPKDGEARAKRSWLRKIFRRKNG